AAALELAEVELRLGCGVEAEATLERVASRHPDWADVHMRLGRARLLRGDPARAQSSLRAALLLNPRQRFTWRPPSAPVPAGAAG
ncbi:MAG TPA: hypothetical protein VJY35_17215, partial [Candidatus Eisenbacteria bacterium]|nr:hypothetical protein [Candidatus Eisenbacteria bacterium]